ncbi:NAD/NADP octopine/nopaline dehydrogenase family protein [Paeniglutamicibacter sp. NPDC091659]|uniref:NAD/NADP octopine/nopaline dehydrogenase family protein n=1 Tax=Paeniglutamicibacter sp. NPDC091659 TaxID=3364389 RepID=UPI0038200F41
MSILIFGDQQAVNVAGYVASVSGEMVYLSASNQVPVVAVERDGGVLAVDVIPLSVREAASQQFEAAIVVTESRRLREAIEPLRFALSGKPLLLAPGGFGGVLRVKKWFEEWSLVPPRLAETTGFPVSGTIENGNLRSHTLKHSLPFAAESLVATQELLSLFERYLPELTLSDLSTTSLSNTNHMIHPSVVLLNAIRVENGEEFSFYRNGLSPAAGRLIERIDAERIEIARRVGAEALTVREWMIRFYGEEGMMGNGIVECLLNFANFERVPSPPSLDYRYIADDVPFGVAQWASLARTLGIETPAMDALLGNIELLAVGVPLEADPITTELFLDHLALPKGV